mgnify:CR=1 FL=1
MQLLVFKISLGNQMSVSLNPSAGETSTRVTRRLASQTSESWGSSLARESQTLNNLPGSA